MKPTSGKKSFDGQKHLINYKAHLKEVVLPCTYTYKIGGNERALLGLAESENHFDLACLLLLYTMNQGDHSLTWWKIMKIAN